MVESWTQFWYDVPRADLGPQPAVLSRFLATARRCALPAAPWLGATACSGYGLVAPLRMNQHIPCREWKNVSLSCMRPRGIAILNTMQSPNAQALQPLHGRTLLTSCRSDTSNTRHLKSWAQPED